MNLAVFELFLSLLRAKQNRIKGMKQVDKVQTQRDRPDYMSSGYSKELKFQNVSYFMVFSSCSEKRYNLICLENWYTLGFFKLNKKQCYAKRWKPYRI